MSKKDLMSKTIFCKTCGNRLTPYLRKDGYSSKSGNKIFSVIYTCNSFFGGHYMKNVGTFERRISKENNKAIKEIK